MEGLKVKFLLNFSNFSNDFFSDVKIFEIIGNYREKKLDKFFIFFEKT